MDMGAVFIFLTIMNFAAVNISVVFFHFEMWIQSGEMNSPHYG